jgi:phage minor structural protein
MSWRAYRLELRDSSGDLVSFLELATEVTWTRARNAPDEIEFTYDGGSGDASSCTRGNEIWLRDSTGTLLQKFRIIEVSTQRRGALEAVQVWGTSLEGQLAEEVVIGYTASSTAISTIVSNLLTSHQVNSDPITLGTIDSAVGDPTRTVSFDEVTIAQALRQLAETLTAPGGWHVTTAGALNWEASPGEDKGQQIRYRKNLLGGERLVDYAELANRIYAYGDGIDLTDAGEANEYIDDATSQSSYGVIPRVVRRQDISSSALLLDYAEAVLDAYKDPRVYYKVDLLALEHADLVGESWEELQIGSTVTVIDEPLGVDYETTVERIVQSLSNPVDVRLELANRVATVGTFTQEQAETLNSVERVGGSGGGSVDFDNSSDVVEIGDSTDGYRGDSSYPARADHSHPIDGAAITSDAPWLARISIDTSLANAQSNWGTGDYPSARDGDLEYDTTNDKLYVRIDGSSKCISHTVAGT